MGLSSPAHCGTAHKAICNFRITSSLKIAAARQTKRFGLHQRNSIFISSQRALVRGTNAGSALTWSHGHSTIGYRSLVTSSGGSNDNGSSESVDRNTAFPVVMTGEPVDNKQLSETLGLVTSTSVMSRNIIVDISLAIMGVLGGPARQYEELTSDAIVRASDGVATAAQKMGADQVINLRIEKAVIVNRFLFGVYVFVTAYGTAIKVK